jgi:acetyltransferase
MSLARRCWFALVVSDKWRSRGIAHHLMRNLMEVARDRDLEVMEGQVLKDNKKMLELMKSLDFKIETDPEDEAIKHVVAKLHSLA